MMKFKVIISIFVATLVVYQANNNCVDCFQESTSKPLIPDTTISTTVSSPVSSSVSTSTSTSTSTELPTTTTKNESLVLSSNDFVDYTESPLLLFDNSDEDNQNENTTTTTKIVTDSLQTNKTSTQPAMTTTTTISSPVEDLEVEDENNKEKSDTNEEDDNSSSVGNEFEKPQNVSHYMDYVEKLFTDLRSQVKDFIEPMMPQLIRSSSQIELSSACSYDVLKFAIALRSFEPWALKLIDSSGKMPEGILEGSFTALGSYDQCISTEFETNTGAATRNDSGGDDDTGEIPTRGKYCLVTVSPFMPPKPPADIVEKLFQEEANKRNYSQTNQFFKLSAMFYYMKFRIGICIPSSCSSEDTQALAGSLSNSLRLNISIPNCSSGEYKPLTGVQLISAVILLCVILSILISTLGHLILKSSRNSRQKVGLESSETTPTSYNIKQANNDDEHSKSWWLSMSLLTTNKLYFNSNSNTLNQTTCTASSSSSSSYLNYNKQTCNNYNNEIRQCETKVAPVVSCLNGIRVISLCWVIIANSYITLDPRATRNLTKSRQAPRDFVFQLIAQASLAIETFFFLSGLLMATSFYNKQLAGNKLQEDDSRFTDNQVDNNETGGTKRRANNLKTRWLAFYIHRYVRVTPATMLVIALSLFTSRFGDGPLWSEATTTPLDNCARNWWMHAIHAANYLDTRQMCFVHYWFIAADMQLFLLGPILLLLLSSRQRAWRALGYLATFASGLLSLGFLFHTTYSRNLPPTLLFYNSDPESRREFANAVMTKPVSHLLPYLVGLLLGRWLFSSYCMSKGKDQRRGSGDDSSSFVGTKIINQNQLYSTSEMTSSNNCGKQEASFGHQKHDSGDTKRTVSAILARLKWPAFGLSILIVLFEIFLPYRWNNAKLPSKLGTAIYASLFRFCWSLALVSLILSCRHKFGINCFGYKQKVKCLKINNGNQKKEEKKQAYKQQSGANQNTTYQDDRVAGNCVVDNQANYYCLCGSGGSLLNKLLSSNVFVMLSKLSFVAYLIHFPLMSKFVAQTRGLFAFSHLLVIHLALSYLLMTFVLSYILVHIIEFPFLTLESILIRKLFNNNNNNNTNPNIITTTNNDDVANKQDKENKRKQREFYKLNLKL